MDHYTSQTKSKKQNEQVNSARVEPSDFSHKIRDLNTDIGISHIKNTSYTGKLSKPGEKVLMF